MSRILPFVAAVALFTPAFASAQCLAPPTPCVCDFAGKTAVLVSSSAAEDGGIEWHIVEQSGQPLGDAGVSGDVFASLRGGPEEIISISDDSFLGSASVNGDFFVCESSKGNFRADKHVVLAAMTSPDCFAAMADAGVPEPKGGFECNDTGRQCSLGGSGTASIGGVAIAFLALAHSWKRRERRFRASPN